jgi:hypothetical protein
MRPDMERPGALAGATGPDIRTVYTTFCEYNISLPLSPAAYVLLFLRLFTMRRSTAESLSVPMKPNKHGRSMERDSARFEWAAVRFVEANQLQSDPLQVVGGYHAPR